MRKPPTVEDVALAAGVYRQTVSNVAELARHRSSGDPGARAARDRVSSHTGRMLPLVMLRTRRSSTIGVHLDPYSGGISGVLLDRFVHALTERASERGMRVLIYSARSAEEEIARLADLIDGAEIDAVVITGTFFGDPRTGWLIGRDVPFVSFGRPWGGEDVYRSAHTWVDVDGAAGTRAATRHALATGAAHVGFFGWPAGAATGRRPRARVAWEMTDAGATGPRFETVDGLAPREERCRGLRQPGVLRELDALVCVSDALAVGAHLAAADAGRRDLPVFGFDNTPVAEALGHLERRAVARAGRGGGARSADGSDGTRRTARGWDRATPARAGGASTRRAEPARSRLLSLDDPRRFRQVCGNGSRRRRLAGETSSSGTRYQGARTCSVSSPSPPPQP